MYDAYKVVYQNEPGGMVRPIIFGMYPKGPAARLTMSNSPAWAGSPEENKAEVKKAAQEHAKDMGWNNVKFDESESFSEKSPIDRPGIRRDRV